MLKAGFPIHLLKFSGIGVVLWCLSPSNATEQSRLWTNQQGKEIQAVLKKANSKEVTLSLASGQKYKVNLRDLSKKDQDYVESWLKEHPDEAAGLLFNWEDPWPRLIQVDSQLQISNEAKNAAQAYVHFSPHYEFICDTKLDATLVKQFAVFFEATHQYIKELPLSMSKAREDIRRQVMLFESKESYVGSGAPANTIAVYMGNQDLIKLPLQSIGVSMARNGLVYDDSKINRLVLYELIRQLNDPVYSGGEAFAWFSQGLAFYIALTPYNKGSYRVSQLLPELVPFIVEHGRDGAGGLTMGKKVKLPDLKEWLLKGRSSFQQEAQKNFGCSALIFYYFVHMDGRGDAAALINFCKARREGEGNEKSLEKLLAGRSWDQLESAISKAWGTRGIDISFD